MTAIAKLSFIIIKSKSTYNLHKKIKCKSISKVFRSYSNWY